MYSIRATKNILILTKEYLRRILGIFTITEVK